MPTIGLKARLPVLGERNVGAAVDADIVVVVEDDQLSELQVTRERTRF